MRSARPGKRVRDKTVRSRAHSVSGRLGCRGAAWTRAARKFERKLLHVFGVRLYLAGRTALIRGRMKRRDAGVILGSTRVISLMREYRGFQVALSQAPDKIGQLSTPIVTDKILKIWRSDAHRPAAAPSAAETDRPEEFVINQSTHGLLGNVQNLRGFGDGIEWLQLLHGVSSLMPVLLRFR